MPMTTADTACDLLIAAPDLHEADALAARLQGASWRTVRASACCNLVRDAVRLAPQAVVVQAPMADDALLADLAPLQLAMPLPVLLFAAAPPTAPGAESFEAAGVFHWTADDCTPVRLALALPLARRLFERQQSLRHELAGAQSRLDERKWVDRAKGVLMSARQLSEPDAFALLRTASMQTNLRVGEVSRAVIEAAEAAEAVNRAGQLRMLSQRLVKALALAQMGVERAAAETMLRDSVERAQSVIDHLDSLTLREPTLALRTGTAAAWSDLRQSLAGPGPAPDLALTDGRAQRLLDEAEALTDALQQISGRRSLQVVNLSGRQRMLSQRVAKQALLAAWLPGPAGDAAAAAALASVAEFDAALLELERSPLAGDEIRSTLAVARGQWQRLLEGTRGAASREGRAVLSRESEALLQSFERLTSLYEHSMQVLLG